MSKIHIEGINLGDGRVAINVKHRLALINPFGKDLGDPLHNAEIAGGFDARFTDDEGDEIKHGEDGEDDGADDGEGDKEEDNGREHRGHRPRQQCVEGDAAHFQSRRPPDGEKDDPANGNPNGGANQ